MAVPNGRNPNETRTRLNDLGDQQIIERQSRGGWRWWWVWPVIIVLAFWWVGWGFGGTGGYWFGGAHSQSTAIPAPPGSRSTETLANAGAQQPPANATLGNPPQQMTGPGVQVLAASNKHTFIGKHFAINDVPVQQKVSDRAVWIGENKPMLAVITNNTKPVTKGEIVDATGTVEKAPSKDQAKREWSLSDSDASRLEREGAYIQVSQLSIPQQ